MKQAQGVEPAKAQTASEWRQHWPLVLAAAAGFSVFSILMSSMGVFMAPIGTEFGWSKTLLSAGLSISAVVVVLLSPFAGALIDRYGSRPVALPGLAMSIIAISAFALADGSAWQWALLWVAYAAVSVFVATTVWTAATASVFVHGRAMAIGATLCGTAVAQVVAPPLSTWLIEVVGWRMAYVWMGTVWGGLALIVCYFFLYDRRALEKSQVEEEVAQVVPSADLEGLSLAEARRDTALWRIGLSTFIMMFLTIGLMLHQVPILMDSGVSAANAAWLASLAGVAGIAGKLVTGVLLDRYRANWVGGLTLGSTALAFCFLLDGFRTPTFIFLAMLLNGYSAGTKLQVCSYLTAQYGGIRHYGAIYGVMNSLVALGSALGPLFVGIIYDSLGGYNIFLIVGTIGCLFSGFLIVTLPGYPKWQNNRDEQEVSSLKVPT